MDKARADVAAPKARRRVAERLPESRILRETLLAISRVGGLPARHQVGTFYTRDGRPVRIGVVGMPDVTACVRGRYIAVECKGHRGRLSKYQKNFREAITKAGGKHFVPKTMADIAEMVAWLEALP